MPDEDALVVRRLRDAGAIILGKTNCPEFAAGGNTFNEVFGRTRNPWDPTKSAGGSTGGGAAALATGMIALAEGTDLGGSLRIPASFCGVVGLRPSVGSCRRIRPTGSWDTLQVTGPDGADGGRRGADAAGDRRARASWSPLAQPTAGRDFVGAVRARTGAAALRDRVLPRHRAASASTRTIERVCRDAAFGLSGRRRIAVEEIDLDLSAARAGVPGAARPLVRHARCRRVSTRRTQFGANVAQQRPRRPGDDARAIWRRRSRSAAASGTRFRELFARFDHLLTPCMAVPPFPVEQNYPDTIAGKPMQTYVDWIAPTFVLSLTGLPVASVPCGLDAGGMPVGLQIVSRPSERRRCWPWRGRCFKRAKASTCRNKHADQKAQGDKDGQRHQSSLAVPKRNGLGHGVRRGQRNRPRQAHHDRCRPRGITGNRGTTHALHDGRDGLQKRCARQAQ